MDFVYSSYRILIQVSILSMLSNGLGRELYIKSSSNSPCSMKICLTLSQLSAKSVLGSLKYNTTLLFLPGDYTLESEISITNSSNFSMRSTSSNTLSIVCNQDAAFKFEGIDRLSLQGFVFVGCGKNEVKSVNDFLLENTTFIGQNGSGTALEIDKTKVSIVDSLFMYNTVGSLRGPIKILEGRKCQYAHVGGAIIANQSNITIIKSRFMRNKAEIGGAIFATRGSHITIINSSFVGNSAVNCSTGLCYGGVLYAEDGATQMYGILTQTTVVLNESEFSSNTATYGGVMTAINSTISVISSKLYNNMAEKFGGGVCMQAASKLKVSASLMENNQALKNGGGVAYMTDASSISVNASWVYQNSATKSGGVVLAYNQCFIAIYGSVVCNNSAQKLVGGVIAVLDYGKGVHSEVSMLSLITIYDSMFDNNFANYSGGVFKIDYASNMTIIRSSFMNNLAFVGGGVVETAGTSVIIEDVSFIKNQAAYGGAIKLFQSNIFFSGMCNLINHLGISGGAIHATESTLSVTHAVILAKQNKVYARGGFLYIYRSKVLCEHNATVKLYDNVARDKGGGICTVNSVILLTSDGNPNTETSMQFTGNEANHGGGIYLELNSQLYISKPSARHNVNFYFTANSANNGGAIYVQDHSFFEACSIGNMHGNYDGTYCFIQVTSHGEIKDFSKFVSLVFTDNSAYSGSILFGGLLDRCTVSNSVKYSSPSSIIYSKSINGVAYFRNISNITNHFLADVISSDSVNLCFCSPTGKPDCSYQAPSIQAKKGEAFNLSLVAVDQVERIVFNTQINSGLKHEESGLGDGQLVQHTNDKCTTLTFNIYSLQPTEELVLYPSGPCDKAFRSIKTIPVLFLNCTCPVGFQPKQVDDNDRCECICDYQLHPYITDPNCDSQTGILLRDGNFWITNLTANTNSPTGYKYLLYPHCPFDYCLPTVHINLNIPNGADAQCANNHSGLLCGSCRPGLSLSLGSSLCIPCSKAWHRDLVAVLVSFFVSGILLVVSILVLNLTVAIGTLNGTIFYANIIGANMSIFFPTANLRFLSILLSWLNLEVGFDTCLYDGMDTYWKTWLQLAFPAYIIMLVIVIIVVSEYSMKFSEVIAKRNPVATLATLILLSYTKLLRIIISSLSFAIISYPGSSHETVWLPDASVKYLRGKHSALFILGILILLVGITYTLLLFFWQWLLRHQGRRFLKWIGHQRLCHFIEPYHAPYTYKHRYWTGLLLLARVVLYLVFALNRSGDPGVNLIAISVIACGLMFLKGLVSRIYKNWMVETINMTCYLNMALLSVSTLFTLEARSNQAIFSFISGTIVILLLVFVLIYHIFIEICLKVWNKFRQKTESMDENNDLLDVSQIIDFDS